MDKIDKENKRKFVPYNFCFALANWDPATAYMSYTSRKLGLLRLSNLSDLNFLFNFLI